MDIKDFILIGGGLLIAAVVAHGFWIAWRERRQDLRIDIKPDLRQDDVDDIDRLRGELPNGGARVARPLLIDPLQDAFDLDGEPLDPAVAGASEARTPSAEAELRAAHDDLDPDQEIEQIDDSDYEVSFADSYRDSAAATLKASGETVRARQAQADPARNLPGDPPAAADPATTTEAEQPVVGRREPDLGEPVPAESESRPRVREVAMPDAIVADRPHRSRRAAERKAAQAEQSQEPVQGKAPARGKELARGKEPARGREPQENPQPAVEELIVMNVLADAPYTGDELFTVLRSCGLKFGEMNIFHRIEPLTKMVNYSIANAVEPGTFDMADMEAIRCPGLCLFMQLPGPEDPVATFEEMLSVARSVTGSLGGEIKDEQRNVMTPQTVEHYRQRILDFSRRRMSKRA